MSSRLTIVVADDHVLVRDAIAGHLQGIDGFEVVGVAADGDAALKLIQEQRPDVAVVDISMPRRNGLRVARQVCREELGVALVLLTTSLEPAVLAEAQRFGVQGFALKSDALSELEVAVRAVASGEAYVSPVLATPKSISSDPRLTRRELEVVRLSCQGLSSVQIGVALSISHRTAETHRHRAMQKLEVGSTAELVRLAIRSGWVTD